MGSDRLRIVVFGAGRWGTHLVRNFLHHPRAELVAIVDPFQDHLHALAQKYDLDSSVVLTRDWQTAMDLPDIDGVAIATPAVTHYPLIHAALSRGYHVLAEKPLTLHWQDCVELCQLAERQRRQLVVDHTYLFHSAVQKGQAVVQQGRVGNLRYGYAARTHLGPIRQDVDALWDLAIHDIAIFNHWLNASPIQVQAHGTIWLQPRPSAAADPPELTQPLFPQGLSDLVWAKLVYPSGVQASIHLCWNNPDKQRRLCLVGDRGTLVFDELQSSTPLVLQQGRLESLNQQFVPVDQHYQAIPVERVESLHQVCDHFLHCIQTNTPSPISSGWTGAQLVKTLAALTTSLNQGGVWVEVAEHSA